MNRLNYLGDYKMTKQLLEVRNLKADFYTEDGVAPVIDGVSFGINRGEIMGVVGESGCGKSVTSLSIMRLLPDPPGRIISGQILFEGKDLLKISEAEMREIRGNEISMIFQEPMTSLNPVYTCGDQIIEALRRHRGLDKKQALEKTIEMLRLVGISSPERRVDAYPHQLSGGMRQRIMIALALSCSPKLLIADEPTTALDTTIQAQILELMEKLQRELGMAIMLITHDLGVIAEVAERVVVMYAGKVVEEADVFSLFENPLHPYTRGLLRSIPHLDAPKERLHTIMGTVPNPLHMPLGCRFNPRCPDAVDICRQKEPPLGKTDSGRQVACWRCSETKGEIVG